MNTWGNAAHALADATSSQQAVGASFFATMAQVIPTIALVIFLTNVHLDDNLRPLAVRLPSEHRTRRTLANEIVSNIIWTVLALIVLVTELYCLKASATGGSETLQRVSLAVTGLLLSLLALLAVAPTVSQLPDHVGIWFPRAIYFVVVCTLGYFAFGPA